MSTARPPTNEVVISGKYRVTGALGKGGMGKVYEAVNDAIGRKVALKLIDPSLHDSPEFMKRFELEAKAAALINHPGIVDVLDMGTTEQGWPFIVMEYLQGVTLRALLRAVGRFSPQEAAAVMLPVLDALGAAHAAGVVHRDLKPANIFIAVKPQAVVKILDFGISKFGSLGQRMTNAGTSMGTPAFMAPEQMLDGSSVGPAADLYSVGTLLYLLLSGHPPFEAATDSELSARVLTGEHKPLKSVRDDVPAELSGLIDRLLQKDPGLRPTNAGLVAQLLREAAEPTPDTVFDSVRRMILGDEAGPAVRSTMPAAKTMVVNDPVELSRPQVGSDTSRRAQTVARQPRTKELAIAAVVLMAVSALVTWFLVTPPAPAARVPAARAPAATPAAAPPAVPAAVVPTSAAEPAPESPPAVADTAEPDALRPRPKAPSPGKTNKARDKDLGLVKDNPYR